MLQTLKPTSTALKNVETDGLSLLINLKRSNLEKKQEKFSLGGGDE